MENRDIEQPSGVNPADEIDSHQHGGRKLWMMICCVPVAVAVIVLVATGIVSGVFVLIALGCIVMMGAMMALMSGASR